MSDRVVTDAAWLSQRWNDWTTAIEVMTPAEWAEQERYLPPSVTNLPGFYRFSVAPYLREILDCLSVESPIREVALQKGAQVGATSGILENAIGYSIAHVKTAPVLMLTADDGLAQVRMTSNIIPMLQSSGLLGCLTSTDEQNSNKTGKSDKKLEWIGGGYLLPFGAKSASKLRSFSARFLLRDEIDGWPLVVGRDGDPIKLSHDRTAAYESTRKILDLSTPTLKSESRIAVRFARGDRRYYNVRCLSCGEPQVLRWRRENRDTGEVTGIVWQLDDEGKLIPGSVRYACKACGHEHLNEDKTRLLSPDHGAEWIPTATPVNPTVRSYHISALYSPVGMQTWEECVRKWLEAWNVKENRPRDPAALQVFYNNVLGSPFETHGEKVKFEQVSPHRRAAYSFGEIPNEFTVAHCGGPVGFLVCAVDVQKTWLAVSVTGFANGRAVLVDYWHFKGDTEQLDDYATWGRLRELIEQKRYTAGDGKRYGIALTVIDSGYRTDQVYAFSGSYQSGVVCLKGREISPRAMHLKHFSPLKAPMGVLAFGVAVDVYKERLAMNLKHPWDGFGVQPEGHFNAPADCTDAQLKELTVETKKERIDPRTKQRIGWEWFRPSGSRNELWDLLVYSSAAADMLAHATFPPDEDRGEYLVDWAAFWRHCNEGAFYELH